MVILSENLSRSARMMHELTILAIDVGFNAMTIGASCRVAVRARLSKRAHICRPDNAQDLGQVIGEVKRVGTKAKL